MDLLNFTKTYAGRYHATGNSHSYLITRNPNGKSWGITIYRLNNPHPVHKDAHDLKRDAVAVARAYESLGNDYQPAEHGGRARYTEAIRVAYGAPAERPLSKRARYNAYRDELREHGLDRLREIVEEIADPSDPRGDDALFVKALYVCMNRVMPRRIRAH